MIKSITTENTKRGDVRKLEAEVTIEGTRVELMHEFWVFLNQWKKSVLKF